MFTGVFGGDFPWGSYGIASGDEEVWLTRHE
jgi:hypothetical protein